MGRMILPDCIVLFGRISLDLMSREAFQNVYGV